MLDETNDAIDMAQVIKQWLGQSSPQVFETVYEEYWCPPDEVGEDEHSDFIRVELIRVRGHNGRYQQTEFLLKTTSQADWDNYEKRQEWLDVTCQSRAIRTAVARFEQLRQDHPYFTRFQVGTVVQSVGDDPITINIGVGIITKVSDAGYTIDLGSYIIFRGKKSDAVKNLRVIAPSIEDLFEGMPHAYHAYLKKTKRGDNHAY